MLERHTAEQVRWDGQGNAAPADQSGTPNYKHKDQMRKANSAVLIECSTICPFKWSVKNGYMCFYCNQRFLEPDLLRRHTSSEHAVDRIRPIIRKVKIEDMVRVDVTSMNCKLCPEELSSVGRLLEHLKAAHGKKFYDQVNEGVVPFVLTVDSFVCALCDERFRAFHPLNFHMNRHYANYYCETCGADFISAQRLRTHRMNHETGRFECKLCEKVFDSYEKRHRHMGSVHSDTQFKCPQCSARFKSYSTRQSHLIKVHGLTHLQHSCSICERVYSNRTYLDRHVRREHLKERNHRCDMCPDSFFTKHSLLDHMVKHTGKRIHECTVCGKSYARKKSLVEHTRIHNNDRRFSCVECGIAFVQKFSLKSHIKTHHFHG